MPATARRYVSRTTPIQGIPATRHADRFPLRTRAILAHFGIRHDLAAACYTTASACWLELPRSMELPYPLKWNVKRRAWCLDLTPFKRWQAARTPAPKRPAVQLVREVKAAAAPAKAKRPASKNACPAGWGEAAWQYHQATLRATSYAALDTEKLNRSAQLACGKLEDKSTSTSQTFRAVLNADNGYSDARSATDAARKLLALGANPERIEWQEAAEPEQDEAADLAQAA